MMYRCLKPLFYMADVLKTLGDDKLAIQKLLDETKYYLTLDIGFGAYMN